MGFQCPIALKFAVMYKRKQTNKMYVLQDIIIKITRNKLGDNNKTDNCFLTHNYRNS